MRRVAIVGCGGAGKSTLARRLGPVLGLPVIHLDSHYWRPGWTGTPEDEWRAAQPDLFAGDGWVADGNFSSSAEVRFALADTIVFLDLPRRTCITRVFLRWWRYRGRTRPDLPEGCPESVDLAFLRWVWSWPGVPRAKLIAKIEAHREGRRVVVLPSPAEVERFAVSVENGGAG